ncbi:MAG: estB [Gammaproteobacteria bacterium]|jgi:phospholipase/carboxylesterase|nr:estB [Gammaproteobacteria bacterium]
MITYTQTTSSAAIEVIPNLPAVGSLIWLHGLGANGRDFASIVPQLHLPDTLPLRFVFPNAPFRNITVNNGARMRAWFDIDSLQHLDRQIDHDGIADSVKLVNQLIENETNNGISTEKIFIGGFSQGAVIALATALHYPNPLGGVIALSGFLPNADKIIQSRSSANKNIPIFLAHGTEDNIVPYMLGQTVAVAFEENNLAVDWHSYAMPHSVCAQEIQDITAWLIKHIR